MFKTSFSFRKATGSPEEICSRLKDLGNKYAPVADLQNTFSFVRWEESCKQNELKPIFGVSLYVTPMIMAKKPQTDLFTFYATDDIHPLNEIIRLAYTQGRSLPRVGFTPLIKYSDFISFPSLIKIAGYRASLEFLDSSDENQFVV